MFWKKKSQHEINNIIFEALGNNLNYDQNDILGLPASYLDREQFYPNAPLLNNAPFLKVLVANPNHIGCHTCSEAEPYFAGTQQIEKDLLKICSEEILEAQPNSTDGYVASGGTEANIQALWIYRNKFQKEYDCNSSQIGIFYSQDAHYSAYKGKNILGLTGMEIKVDELTRKWNLESLENACAEAIKKNIKGIVLFLTMGTTMFGSIDDIDEILPIIKKYKLPVNVHLDAAFGGFIYPFTNENNKLNFANSNITSIAIDGHKMLQTPYGTGIFICKKGLMKYTKTNEAKYVKGTDFTLCGSRSGANAISIWIILMNYGSEGWKYKTQQLLDRKYKITSVLDLKNKTYFSHPFMNIVTIKADSIDATLAKKYHLVADDYDNPKWWKIVIMDHVQSGILDKFASEI